MADTGVSVKDLSVALSVSEKSIYNYLSGSNDPPSSTIAGIVTYFSNLSAHWMLTGKGKPWGEDGRSAQVAIGNGNKQHMGLSAECLEKLSAAEREIGLLKQILAEKERVILLLEKSNQ